jgi:hypothetical protein
LDHLALGFEKWVIHKDQFNPFMITSVTENSVITKGDHIVPQVISYPCEINIGTKRFFFLWKLPKWDYHKREENLEERSSIHIRTLPS